MRERVGLWVYWSWDLHVKLPWHVFPDPSHLFSHIVEDLRARADNLRIGQRAGQIQIVGGDFALGGDVLVGE